MCRSQAAKCSDVDIVRHKPDTPIRQKCMNAAGVKRIEYCVQSIRLNAPDARLLMNGLRS